MHEASSCGSLGTLMIVAGVAHARLGAARLAVAGPVHGALHALEAAPARLELRQARRGRSDARPPRPDASPADRAAQHRDARRRRYRSSSKRGEAIGRLSVPRLGLNMVLVNGTDHDSLKKGPGRDLRTYMPGEGQLVYVAGHRTTYLAPFSHIDRLRPGDRVTLELPYGTFIYRVTRHRIVTATDLSVLRSHGARSSRCRPATRASSRRTATSPTRSCVRVEPRGGRVQPSAS